MRVSFADHVDLLSLFLAGRSAIVEQIERRLLNVRDKDLTRQRHRGAFADSLDVIFFSSAALPPPLMRLRGELSAARRAAGFEPADMGASSRELDPADLLIRAYDYWSTTRWPGNAGRLAYARTLFAVYLLRQLEHLSLRIWDDEGDASARLQEIQRLLDRLNTGSAPILVRDARWVLQTAQGPLTRQLAPYFEISGRIATSFSRKDVEGIHIAGAKLAGGHLRSQLRYRSEEIGRPIDDTTVLSMTRNSNAMDLALLVADLVPLLDEYVSVSSGSDHDAKCQVPGTKRQAGRRSDLADAILQGLSADPDLLVSRLDLLKPYTILEELFVERAPAGVPQYTALGAAHLVTFDRYAALLAAATPALQEDARRLTPDGRAYSPLGIAYGFCADLLSNMATAALLGLPGSDLSIEDLLASDGQLDDKAARASAWARLPARAGEREHFMHSPDWAGQMFTRTATALDQRAALPAALNASPVRQTRLFVVPASIADTSPAPLLPDGVVDAQEHCIRSDFTRAMAEGATAFPRRQIEADRTEGRFLASSQIDGRWFGVSKVVLTACLGRGQDGVIKGVPAEVCEVLPLTCPELAVILQPS